MDNIILILPGTIALGDEIGIYRIFLLEMLSMNKIDKNAPNFMWKRQDVSL
jgi:hypothetical protein